MESENGEFIDSDGASLSREQVDMISCSTALPSQREMSHRDLACY